MKKAIDRLHVTLNAHKGFETAHTSSNESEMLIEIDCKLYKITLEDTGEKNMSMEAVNRYLK